MGTPRLSSVGRYELLIELAKGGMAELYLARLHGVGGFAKLVAIKRILPHLAEDKQFVEMFLNEGRIAAQLSHPNVCQVHELDDHEGELFLAMEYLEGVPWDALIRSQPRTPATLRLAAGVIAQACEGLHYAHELRDLDGSATPVIHRDVSPQNLFVTVDGVCKVLDFGVSKMVKDGPRTRTGVIKGKLPYMSPEQIQGDPIDARADVFALGVVLWEALAGESLFDRDTDFQIWKAVTEAPIPLLASRGFPVEVDAVLGAALARDRDHRFRTARALGEALRHAADQVGGAYDAAEIAAAVKRTCGPQLEARQREVASIVTQRRSQPTLGEPTAADTIDDRAGARDDSTASSTVSLRSERPGSTVSLRQDPVKVERPAMRARWPYVIAGAGVVAGVVVLALALGRSSRPAEVRAAASDEARDDANPDPSSRPPLAMPMPPIAVGPVEPAADPAPVVPPPATGTGRGPGRWLGSSKLDRALGALDQLHSPRPDRAGTGTGSGARRNDGDIDAVKAAMQFAGVGSNVERLVDDVLPRKPATAGAESRAPGSYTIDSTPYATIYLSGTKVGETPLYKLSVSPGTHQVRAVLADGRERTFSIVVAPGQAVSSGKLSWSAERP